MAAFIGLRNNKAIILVCFIWKPIPFKVLFHSVFLYAIQSINHRANDKTSLVCYNKHLLTVHIIKMGDRAIERQVDKHRLTFQLSLQFAFHRFLYSIIFSMISIKYLKNLTQPWTSECWAPLFYLIVKRNILFEVATRSVSFYWMIHELALKET